MLGNITSIDLGSHSVKALKVKRGFKNFKILQFEEEKIQPWSSQEEFLEALEKSLSGLNSRINFKDSRIILTMPTDRVLLRKFEFPFGDISKIAEVLPFEAEENIPYSMDTIAMDFQSVPGSSKESRTILFAGANKELVHSIAAIFNNMGFSPDFFGLESNSILCCYNNLNPEDSKSKILQIDLGHKKTVVNIAESSSILATRAIPIGMESIVTEIARVLKIEKEESERIAKNLDLDLSDFDSNLKNTFYRKEELGKNKLKKIFNIYKDTIQEILSEVVMTLKANSIDEIKRVVLSGGGSGIKGLTAMAEDFLGVPATFMPFPQEEIWQSDLIKYTIAYGTIIDYLYNKKNSINFIKGEFASDVSGTTWKIYYLPGLFIAMTLVLGIANAIYSYYSDSINEKKYKSIIEQRYKRYFKTRVVPENPIKKARELLRKEEKDLKILNDLVGKREKFMETLGTITQSLPQENFVFELMLIDFDKRSITISGKTDNIKNIESLKANLIASKKFESVTLESQNVSSNIIKFKIFIKKEI